MGKQESCEERIDDYMRSRLDDIGSSLKWAQAWSTSDKNRAEERADAAWERLDEMPLAVEIKKLVKVTLGTGGPADWFEAVLDESGAPERITYHFADWWDHADRVLTGPDFETAEQFIARVAYIEA